MSKVKGFMGGVMALNCALFNLSYAHSTNISYLTSQCHKVATHLRQTILTKKDYCTGDIESVALSLERAGEQLTRDTSERVLVAVKYAALELKEIQNSRSYCHHYFGLLTSELDEVNDIANYIEHLGQDSKKLSY